MNRLGYLSYSVILIICVFMFSGFTYAYKSYSIGDEVDYNDIKFYVIKDSSSEEEYVTMLKAEPLTVAEVNLYGGVGTENNHVNKYTSSSLETAFDVNGYGGMAYYTSETCGYINYNWIDSGCNTEYNDSDIKFAVDAWTGNTIVQNDLVVDSLGFKSRLITKEEIDTVTESVGTYNNDNFIYNIPYYWSMSLWDDFNVVIRVAAGNGNIFLYGLADFNSLVRPVITLKKSAIEKDEDISDEPINPSVEPDKDESNDIVPINNINNNKSQEEKIKVKVSNTFEKISIISILIGVVLISISIVSVVKTRR